MNINNALRWDIENGLRNDLAVCDDDDAVGRDLLNGLHPFRCADLGWLMNGNGVLKSERFRWRHRKGVSSPSGFVRLREECKDIVAGVDEGLE
jgi:hypothetical protein